MWSRLGIAAVFVLIGLVFSLVPNTRANELIGPLTYPPGVNPLTGQVVSDPAVLQRRPIIVKISNYPPVVRSYQRGINEADLVWETLLSGGVTRFSAVFYGSDYPQVGPIRSGRLVDFELTRIYRALYTYSGMAQGTIDILNTDRLMLSRVVGGAGPCPPLCRVPQDGLALEHTLFGDTAALREHAVTLGRDVNPEPIYGMAFATETPEGGRPLASVSVRYAESVVDWTYDADLDLWLRTQDGEPHFDGNGQRISANTIIILEDQHTIQPSVAPGYWGPGDFAFSVNLIDRGPLYMLRDGQYWHGEWRRAAREEPLTFFDQDGQPLAFEPGHTWFNLVPRWIDGYELVFTPPDPPVAVVNGSTGVSMRYGPSEAYRTPDVAYPGDTFAVLGRNWNGTWLQVQRDDSRHVWLPLDRLEVNGLDVMSLPNPRPTNERG